MSTVGDVLDNLVSQFTDPFTFYRELIQNAMDAGTDRVEVRLSYRPDEERMVVEVGDSGEGMDRRVIYNELTRLFSSSKEDDRTKIGKFGIGFVSVFALGPEMVVVDTGRGGESWRVVFDGSPDFECLRLSTPIEGTHIRLYLKLSPDHVEAFVQRSRHTIEYWCRFSDTPILFSAPGEDEPRPLNDALDVESICKVRSKNGATEIVAGLTDDPQPLYGMYNRGLTLKEARETLFTGVTLRIKSPYLEHTLTRDNVRQDDNYKKAMKLITDVVRMQLSAQFFEVLRPLLEQPPSLEVDTKIELLFGAAASFLAEWKRMLPRKFHDLPLFPTLHGPPLSLRAVRRFHSTEGAVYVGTYTSVQSDQLHQAGIPIVRCMLTTRVASVLEALTGQAPRLAHESVLMAHPLPPTDQPYELHKIQQQLLDLTRVGGNSFKQALLADFGDAAPAVRQRPCLVQPSPGEPIRLFNRGFWRSLHLGAASLYLNAAHPLVRTALAQAQSKPVLASYVLARTALLEDGLDETVEARLLALAVRPT
jgi:hypothetical protein